jgi:Fe-S-cluster-containing dehydrogenase component
MAISRRNALKVLAGAGAASVASPVEAFGKAEAVDTSRMTGMLYDATLCIGCKACMTACQEANEMEQERGALWSSDVDLSSRTKNVIKFYQGPEGTSFMKMQCMHCIEPACAAACMLGALHKDDEGVVTWDGDLCVGCRYCQVACPFNVPKFEWDSAAPKIVKCELCKHRTTEGKRPACVEVCPREAVIYGKRDELLKEARRRIAENPGKYDPKVFGETDGGGTQVLYLSAASIGFQNLGLPVLGTRSLPDRVHGVQGLIYRGFIAPVVLYGALAATIYRNHKRGHADGDAHEEA